MRCPHPYGLQVRRGIKYVLLGGVPFWRRTEIQDVLAYLR